MPAEIRLARANRRSARASRISALRWYDLARLEADLGILNYTLARGEARGSELHGRLIEEAIAADLRAIKLAPTAAYSWLRLAQAHIERDGAAADIAPYLRMFYAMARYDPRVVLTRLDIAFPRISKAPIAITIATASPCHGQIS